MDLVTFISESVSVALNILAVILIIASTTGLIEYICYRCTTKLLDTMGVVDHTTFGAFMTYYLSGLFVAFGHLVLILSATDDKSIIEATLQSALSMTIVEVGLFASILAISLGVRLLHQRNITV